jgi:hypothetical protein
MKRLLFALAVLLSAGLAMLPEAARSQVPGQSGKGLPFDLGPTDKGATLRQPWLETGTPAAGPTGGAQPSYVQNLLNQSGAPSTTSSPAHAVHSSLMPYDDTGINNDILVSKDMGPWMLLLVSYAGPEGPMRARKMVIELRGTYKLPAYVFNYGQEEKRKELERVKAIIDKHKKFLADNNLPADNSVRVKHLKIDEHCGVLIGGYPTQEAAVKARGQIKNLKPPDPFVFKQWQELLDVKFVTPDEDGKTKGAEGVYVNPFARAFVVRNPCVKVERPAEWDKLDVAMLRRMNTVEDFSLLQCKKNFTLAIKQYNLPSVTTPRIEAPPSGGFWDSMGFGKKARDPRDIVDAAAENAHNLAEALRKKNKLDAYVLHTKYYSLVTIGGYDALDDANLRTMQNLIETRLLPAMPASMEMFAKAMPMQIPH